MTENNLKRILKTQEAFFCSGRTRSLTFRMEALGSLKKAILKYEEEIYEALKKDLGKPPFETYASEIGITLQEIRLAMKNLSAWMRKRKVKTPLLHFIASSYYRYEPFGKVLIISPWNYPFQLLMIPLIGAIAAGNCVFIKPSQYAANTASVIKRMLEEVFPEEYVYLTVGGKEVNRLVLQQKWDYIFFTGSSQVGKLVMAAASNTLTPFSLELGGKNPIVVSDDANLKLAARRILWGKFLNAGQSCVAGDYVLVDEKIKDGLLQEMADFIRKTYGDTSVPPDDFCRIINEQNVDRLLKLMEGNPIYYGGNVDRSIRYVEPTILTDVDADSMIMKEEIFGPLLPVIGYDRLDEAVDFITERSRPLALYVFSGSRRVLNRVVQNTQSGTYCWNETVVHFINSFLPFGGVGKSGIGRYHGRFSFEAFSYKRAFMHKSTLIDTRIRYAPYGNKIKILKRFLR